MIGVENIQRGFIGCMDDIRLAKVALPLHMSGTSSVAFLKLFYNIEFNCNAGAVSLDIVFYFKYNI